MTKQETRKFLERIKSHYPEFIIDDFKLSEWHEELKKYDNSDVNERLEMHIKNSEYGRFAPKLYFLTKFLKTDEERQQNKTWIIKCDKCGKTFTNLTYSVHYDTCVLISSMIRDLKRYFNQDISREKLESIDQKHLNELYNKYIDKMLACEMVPQYRKITLEKCYFKEIKEPKLDNSEVSSKKITLENMRINQL